MTTSIRPTQNRLLLALVPATVIVALLMQTLSIMFYSQIPALSIYDSPGRALSILLLHPAVKDDSAEPVRRTKLHEDVTAIVEQESSSKRVPLRPLDSVEAGALPTAVEQEHDASADRNASRVDWQRLARSTSKEYLELLHTDEARRAERWRTSGSVLFEPRGDMPNTTEVNMLPDYRFLEPVGVLGLGLTFGQCFVGLPLIGVPIEDRTPAITLVYCRR